MWQTIKFGCLAGGGQTKAEDLAYQSGTDGKLQVFYQKATKFCQRARSTSSWGKKKVLATKGAKKRRELENVVVFAFASKKLLIIFAEKQ